MSNLANQIQIEQKKDFIEILLKKFDRRLSEEISDLKVALLEKIAELDNRLSAKISEVDKKLFQEISKTRTDLIKWMFIFWIGQLGVILGILFTFFKE